MRLRFQTLLSSCLDPNATLTLGSFISSPNGPLYVVPKAAEMPFHSPVHTAAYPTPSALPQSLERAAVPTRPVSTFRATCVGHAL